MADKKDSGRKRISSGAESILPSKKTQSKKSVREPLSSGLKMVVAKTDADKKSGGSAPSKNQKQKIPRSERTYLSRVSPGFQVSIKRAIENVSRLGDTDVFPRSYEVSLLDDVKDEVAELLAKIHIEFAEMLEKNPPLNDRVLAPVGYSGFRVVTQVDSIWNLYLLSLVVHIGAEIESERVPAAREVVHSYRFQPEKDQPQIFSKKYGWYSFASHCEILSSKYKFVLITDISDFYPRIYHHRLENALKKASTNTDAVKRIIRLLSEFSGNVSYGLPVGGPASRLLSEMLLNATDRLLLAEGIEYARFVDDFRIFANSKEEAHAHLVTLAQKIGESEGLALQKSKTKIVSSEEYLALTGQSKDVEVGQDSTHDEFKRFMALKLHFDPYSESAREDYEQLRDALQQFDVVTMLAREVKKSQIEESVSRKLIRAIRHLPDKAVTACMSSLSENLELLSPVFPLVMQVFSGVFERLPLEARDLMIDAVKRLFIAKSHIVQVPLNQAFAVRVLARSRDEDSERILHEIYKTSSSIGVRRDVVIAMANRDVAWFVSDRRRNYATLTSWERRAILAASYVLEDEGDHWRKYLNSSDFERVISKWVANKKAANKGKVELPL